MENLHFAVRSLHSLIFCYREMVLKAENTGKSYEFLLAIRKALSDSLGHLTEDIHEEDIYERETSGVDSYFTIKRKSFVVQPHIKDDFFDKDSYKVKIFTDNIVIGYPVMFDDAESELGRIFFSLAFFQLSMVNQGFFLRGAISIDNLYIDRAYCLWKGVD